MTYVHTRIRLLTTSYVWMPEEEPVNEEKTVPSYRARDDA